MSSRDAVQDHDNGIRYGGTILSLMPAPEGWTVSTQVQSYNPKTKENADDPRQVSPLIGWGLVDAMFWGGGRRTCVEPLFLNAAGSVTHSSEFRWEQGAGNVDDEGWRTAVAVKVIPAPSAVPTAPSTDVEAVPARQADRAGGRDRCPNHPAAYRSGCIECALAVSTG
ncbi:hypothetical protein [Streptomyces virginiae]|uniref:hypothetical protein n=1 Tax=Streptomyces virginiae TaxID=1961 RepID=UPI0032506864